MADSSCRQFLLVFILGLRVCASLCEEDDKAVYIVTLKHVPVSHYTKVSSPKLDFHPTRKLSRINRKLKGEIHRFHDSLLADVLGGDEFVKLYSYHYLLNGFTVVITHQQAERLAKRREVENVVLDFSVKTATTRTPQFLGLPHGAWPLLGGHGYAGEGVVIGFVDTGIDPTHPSFADDGFPYPVPRRFTGICEVSADFPSGSCNRKLIGARHFASAAATRGILNVTQDNASPIDGDGHGTHTASVAAGNFGVPVVVAGHYFGNASGMAPRAQISVYKALYKHFGGFVADIVAAIDQAAEDGVDIINLSITPNNRPPGIATFFNPLDTALLSAVKAGIFVVQAAGNEGPGPRSMSSFSPWICTVGASSHDRTYSNSIILGDKTAISGHGLAPGTPDDTFFPMVSATDALNETTSAAEMYSDECQDPRLFIRGKVAGKLLICKYTVRYVLGISSIKTAVETAANLSAAGIIFSFESLMYGFKINPTPIPIPGIIISNPDDSKALFGYYKSSEKKLARISGLKTDFSSSSPSIMYYSARGPDPESASLGNADILKPTLVAPGNFIWGGWSSAGTESVEFQGESFAMLSGTSMAAPHIAGVAALVKQKFPSFSPAAITSALSTTASSVDREGQHILAQRFSALQDDRRTPATPFDMGAGFVNTTAALDPGLVFDTGFRDFMSFLCGFNGSAPLVYNRTGERCSNYNDSLSAADLNLPSITIANLDMPKTVRRTVTNVAGNETYTARLSPPFGVSVQVFPAIFSVAGGSSQVVTVTLAPTLNSSEASFGKIELSGSRGHVVVVPLSVVLKTYTHVT